jgi:hypothetical protein
MATQADLTDREALPVKNGRVSTLGVGIIGVSPVRG